MKSGARCSRESAYAIDRKIKICQSVFFVFPISAGAAQPKRTAAYGSRQARSMHLRYALRLFYSHPAAMGTLRPNDALCIAASITAITRRACSGRTSSGSPSNR